MANYKYPEHERYRRKAQRKLEGLDYTPMISRILSAVLLALRDEKTTTQRDAILEFFSTCAKGEMQ